MKLRILCNWMTPASNIVIQPQFGRLATADVLGLKPIISLSLDWLCGITLGFPQCSRWWRLKGISSRSLILLPIHALFYIKQSIILPLARKKPHSHAWCSPHAQRRHEQRCKGHILLQCSPQPSLHCKICWGQPASKTRCFPLPSPMWHWNLSPPEMAAGAEKPPRYPRWVGKLRRTPNSWNYETSGAQCKANCLL